MSCALALVAAFALSPAAAGGASPTPAAAGAPATRLAAEPLFADIVSRARSLHRRTQAYAASGTVADAALFRADLSRLAELDMEGHRTLAARGTDPDLKCMLRGMSEDLTRRLGEIDRAADAAARRAALTGLGTTLEENAGVIEAPSRPPV